MQRATLAFLVRAYHVNGTCFRMEEQKFVNHALLELLQATKVGPIQNSFDARLAIL